MSLWVLPTVLDLCRADADTSALVAMLKHLGELHGQFRLVVVDTLNRSMGTGDENASGDMGGLIRNLDRLRAPTGAHVMLIHHVGKDAARGARGHSSLRAAVDTEIELTRNGNAIIAKAKKQRDMPCEGTFTFRLVEVEFGPDQDGDPVTTCRVEPCKAPDRRPKVTGQALIALQALNDVLAQYGAVKVQDGFPPCPVVSIEKWRDMADKCGLSDADKPDTHRRAFGRAVQILRKREYVREHNGFAWRI